MPNGGKVPSAPTQVTAAVSGSSVTINWARPSNSGSSQITQYEVFDNNDVSVCVWTIGPRQCVVNNLAPGDYRFKVTAMNSAGTSAVSSLSNRVTIAGDSRNNDFFSQSKVLNRGGGSTTGTNEDATKESDEPITYGSTNATKWYRFTPATSSSVTIDLSGSAFDTVLGVYTGSSVSQLILIAKDDDSGDGSASKLTFNATEGVSYKIQVGSYGYTTGSITLAWGTSTVCSYDYPTNDQILGAIRISGSGVSCVDTSYATTTSSFEPFYSSTDYSIWYVIKPKQSTTVTLDLSGSEFDTFLSVHRTSVLPPGYYSDLATVAYDDDSGDGYASRISDLSISPGYWYYVRVAGLGWSRGDSKLTWTIGGRPSEPTNVTASAAESSATISWDAPNYDGGSTITSYEVVSNRGNYSCSTRNQSCEISDMAYGQYSFTVSAINANNRGVASSPSNSVVVGNRNICQQPIRDR